MTRDERLALMKVRVLARQHKEARELAKIDTEQRARARKVREARRYAVGRLADAAGLLAWDDAVLRPLFAALATLAMVPDPVAVIEVALEVGRGETGTLARVGALPFEGKTAKGAAPESGLRRGVTVLEEREA